MSKFTYETLSLIQGEYVELADSEGNRCHLKIDKVCEGKLNDDEWTSFSVHYKGDAGIQIPQGTYRLRHPSFETEVEFLVPKSPVDYETVITRRKEAG